MEHTLPPLPYAMDALAPHISRETFEYHYGKHHQTYVTNLNNLIEGTDLANKSLEEIVQHTDAPVYLLDEWDANLDGPNRAAANALVEELAKRARVIEISHRDAA